MIQTRVIPSLLLVNETLVKTVKFKDYSYIGDPINTVRIFNEFEVDELLFLDIRATVEGRKPNLSILKEIADQCFMPLAYGGGIKSIDSVKQILSSGFEKVTINSEAFENPDIITEIADNFGSQCVVASIDVKKNFFGKYQVFTRSGTKKTGYDPVSYAQLMEKKGAGEILLYSIDNDGTWSGYDKELISKVTKNVSIPVIACGGASSLDNLSETVDNTAVSAVSAGSLFVFQQKDCGVLVNYPSREKLDDMFPFTEEYFKQIQDLL